MDGSATATAALAPAPAPPAAAAETTAKYPPIVVTAATAGGAPAENGAARAAKDTNEETHKRATAGRKLKKAKGRAHSDESDGNSSDTDSSEDQGTKHGHRAHQHGRHGTAIVQGSGKKGRSKGGAASQQQLGMLLPSFSALMHTFEPPGCYPGDPSDPAMLGLRAPCTSCGGGSAGGVCACAMHHSPLLGHPLGHHLQHPMAPHVMPSGEVAIPAFRPPNFLAPAHYTSSQAPGPHLPVPVLQRPGMPDHQPAAWAGQHADPAFPQSLHEQQQFVSVLPHHPLAHAQPYAPVQYAAGAHPHHQHHNNLHHHHHHPDQHHQGQQHLQTAASMHRPPSSFSSLAGQNPANHHHQPPAQHSSISQPQWANRQSHDPLALDASVTREQVQGPYVASLMPSPSHSWELQPSGAWGGMGEGGRRSHSHPPQTAPAAAGTYQPPPHGGDQSGPAGSYQPFLPGTGQSGPAGPYQPPPSGADQSGAGSLPPVAYDTSSWHAVLQQEQQRQQHQNLQHQQHQPAHPGDNSRAHQPAGREADAGEVSHQGADAPPPPKPSQQQQQHSGIPPETYASLVRLLEVKDQMIWHLLQEREEMGARLTEAEAAAAAAATAPGSAAAATEAWEAV